MGEPLSKEQQQVIRQWIAEGAEWPATADAFIEKELAAMVLPKITFALPAVDAAGQAAIDEAVAELKKRGAVVQQVAADTPAIDVNLSLLRDKVTDADVSLLVPLANRLVWLNLSRTAVTDGAAKSLSALTQLRRLHAANTKLTDATFGSLGGLQQLEYLNAYGTGLTDDGLAKLAAMPKLERLYAWQTKVTPDAAKQAREKSPKLQLDLGDYVEERMASAQKEIEERNARNKPVNETDDRVRGPAHRLLLREVQGGVPEGSGQVLEQAAAEVAAPRDSTGRLSGGDARPGRARGRASSRPPSRAARRALRWRS